MLGIHICPIKLIDFWWSYQKVRVNGAATDDDHIYKQRAVFLSIGLMMIPQTLQKVEVLTVTCLL